MIIRFLSGAAVGLLCSLLSFFLAEKLLQRRGHELCIGKTEKWLFPVCMALGGAGIVVVSGLSVAGFYYFLLLFIGGTLSLTDIHFRIIPNDLLIALLATALIFGIPRLLGQEAFPAFRLGSSLAGLAVCFIIFMLPAALSKKIGAGDVKLAASMGFALGFQSSLLAITLMGVLILCFTFLQRKAPSVKFIKTMIPLGPFIAVVMVAVPLLLQYSGSAKLAAVFSF